MKSIARVRLTVTGCTDGDQAVSCTGAFLAAAGIGSEQWQSCVRITNYMFLLPMDVAQIDGNGCPIIFCSMNIWIELILIDVDFKS